MSRPEAGEQASAGSAVCVFIVSRDAAMRHGLALRLDAEPDITVIGTAASPAEVPADAGASTVVVLGVHRDDSGADDATAGRITGLHGPRLVLLGLDSCPGPVGGRPFVSMHDGDAVLLRAIRRAAAHDPQGQGRRHLSSPSASLGTDAAPLRR